MRHPTHDNCPTCAARERARIRRLIGPALRKLRNVRIMFDCFDDANAAVLAIDAATRPESKRKRGAK